MWARRNGVCPLPADPGDVASHLSGLFGEGRALSTVKVRRAAIRAAHRAAGLTDPGRSEEVARECDRIASAGAARRRSAVVPASAARRAAVQAAGEGNEVGWRDAAILELLSSGWLRPGELVRLDWADLTAPPAGDAAAVVAVQDVDGGEALLEVPPPAWRRLREWRRAAAEPDAGPMFCRLGAAGSARLGPRDLRRIVSRRLKAVGVTGATPSGLRAGAAVAAFQQGSSLPDVLRRGRWNDARQPAQYAAAAETANNDSDHSGSEPTAAAATAAYPAAETAGDPGDGDNEPTAAAATAAYPAAEAATAEAAGNSDHDDEPTAAAATAAYLAAEADTQAALDHLHRTLKTLQQAVGPQQAANITNMPAHILDELQRNHAPPRK